MRPSFHYESEPRRKSGRYTPYGIELRDAHNRPLETQRILLTDPYCDLDSPGVDFFKQIPFDPETARVVFTCGPAGGCEQKELLAVDVPPDPPKVKILEPQGAYELTGKVRVVWNGECQGKTLRYMLRYSSDSGKTFRAVAPSMSEMEYTVDLDALPGGDRCRFQVLATEGIRTGRAESDEFRVPRKRRQVAISAESPRAEITHGETLTLSGVAFSPDAGSADPRNLEWSSDRDGGLGIGAKLIARSLSPGEHVIALRAPDGLGGTSVAEHRVRVVRAPVVFHTSREYPKHTQKDHDSGKVPPRSGGQTSE